MLKAVYPGSFDPLTNGHLDIIERASALVDVLVVAVLENPNKNCLFTPEERKDQIKTVTRKLPNVEVESFCGLLTDFAERISARVIIRGVRTLSDFECEFQRSLTNKKLNPGMETLFLTAKDENIILSSTADKEVATFNGDISWMVPAEIIGLIREKYKK